MSKNLFDIEQEYLEAMEAIENYCLENQTDEVPQELLDKLQINEEDLHNKLDAYKHRILELEKEEEMLGEYIKNLQGKKKRIKESIDRLKSYAGQAIETFGEENKSGNHFVQTSKFKVTASRSKKLVVTDESVLPDKYKIEETVVKVDTKQLKKDLLTMDWDERRFIEGAEIDTDTVNVSWR